MTGSRQFIDISVPLSPDLPSWPGDPKFSIEPAGKIADGEPSNVSRLSISTHGGTHLDACWHFIDDGKRLEAIELSTLIGPCVISDLTHITSEITASDLDQASLPTGTERLLLKTRNSENWSKTPLEFDEQFIGLSVGAAQWLVEHEIKLVGIDYFSVEPLSGDGTVHRILLGAELVLVEALDLREIAAGRYGFICLPLAIPGADGSPCRAILTTGENAAGV